MGKRLERIDHDSKENALNCRRRNLNLRILPDSSIDLLWAGRGEGKEIS